MSFPDFGIYPEELIKCNRLTSSIAKRNWIRNTVP